jgi:hypothetical protein
MLGTWAGAGPVKDDASPAARAAIIEASLAAFDARAARMLVGARPAAELVAARRGYGTTWTPAAVATPEEQELAYALHAASNSVMATGVIASFLFGMLALVGLLGLFRLRRRGMTIISAGLGVLAAGTGVASIALFDGQRLVLLVPTALCLLGTFGQLVAANLMPDADHPWILAAEARLRALAPARRVSHVLMRVGIGLGASAIALGASVWNIHHGPGRWVPVYTGGVAMGLIFSALPLIAMFRVRGCHEPEPQGAARASAAGE